MRRQEIARKFDEIVTFAGVERFVDTPVKRYSSGMSVRLAFAVAAHLEPEILLVDEVLAVGDAEFRRRCLGRMQDLGETGRTIVFVSHNMQAITQLCDRSILLDQGSIELDGPSSDVVRRYLEEHAGAAAQQLAAAGRARGRPRAHSLGPCRGCTGRARRGGRRQAAGRDRARPDDPAPRRGRHHAEDQARRRSGAGRVQRHRHRPAVARAACARGLCRHGVDRAACSTRPRQRRRFRRQSRRSSSITTPVSTTPSRSTCRIPEKATPRAATTPELARRGASADREWTLRRAVAAGADPSVLFLYRDSPLRRRAASARRPARPSATSSAWMSSPPRAGGRPTTSTPRPQRRPGYRRYGRPAHSHGGRLQRRLRRRAEEPLGHRGRGRRLLDGGHGRHPARAASARAPGRPYAVRLHEHRAPRPDLAHPRCAAAACVPRRRRSLRRCDRIRARRGGRAPCVAERRRGTAAGPLRSVRRRHGRGQAFRTDTRGRRRVRWCRSHRDHDLLLRVAARTPHVSYRLVAGGEERPVDVPPNVRLDPEVLFRRAGRAGGGPRRGASGRRQRLLRGDDDAVAGPGAREIRRRYPDARDRRGVRPARRRDMPARAARRPPGAGARCRRSPRGSRGPWRSAGGAARTSRRASPGSATPRRSARSCAASRVVSRLRSAARRRAPRGRR